MPLVLGFVELLGAALLLTSAIADASFADVLKGNAGRLFRQNSTASAAAAASPGSSTGTLTPASAAQVNTATGAVAGSGKAGLTSAQQTFAQRLAIRTGLDPRVISAWLLAEESGSAAQSRQAASNNDWLNIGYTDTATLGAANSVWTNPVSAADASAAWLAGSWSDPGFGSASSGIRAILSTAGRSAAAQIHAIQTSGWASSGYPDLPSIYQEIG